MKFSRRQFLHLAGGAAALTAVSLVAALVPDDIRAQATRTIKVVVPFAASGPGDTLARLVAEQVGRTRGAYCIC
jgi:tripartite-type tricarboxylate transporter receptor subunit TctC